MRNGEIACYKQFLLFSQCFPQLYTVSFVHQNAVLCKNGLLNYEQCTRNSIARDTPKMKNGKETKASRMLGMENIVMKKASACNKHYILFL